MRLRLREDHVEWPDEEKSADDRRDDGDSPALLLFIDLLIITVSSARGMHTRIYQAASGQGGEVKYEVPCHVVIWWC